VFTYFFKLFLIKYLNTILLTNKTWSINPIRGRNFNIRTPIQGVNRHRDHIRPAAKIGGMQEGASPATTPNQKSGIHPRILISVKQLRIGHHQGNSGFVKQNFVKF